MLRRAVLKPICVEDQRSSNSNGLPFYERLSGLVEVCNDSWYGAWSGQKEVVEVELWWSSCHEAFEVVCSLVTPVYILHRLGLVTTPALLGTTVEYSIGLSARAPYQKNI